MYLKTYLIRKLSAVSFLDTREVVILSWKILSKDLEEVLLENFGTTGKTMSIVIKQSGHIVCFIIFFSWYMDC